MKISASLLAYPKKYKYTSGKIGLKGLVYTVGDLQYYWQKVLNI